MLADDVDNCVDLMPPLVLDCRVCQGGSLAENLQYLCGNPGPVIDVINNVLLVNEQMHARDMAHGDLKLENILLRMKNNFRSPCAMSRACSCSFTSRILSMMSKTGPGLPQRYCRFPARLPPWRIRHQRLHQIYLIAHVISQRTCTYERGHHERFQGDGHCTISFPVLRTHNLT